MIRELEKDKWKGLYNEHLKKDFPRNELYSLNGFLKESESKRVYIYIENEEEKAYMVTGEGDHITFVYYFAVFSDYRGQGIGTKFLKEYIEKNNKTIVLEIEDPKKSKNDKEKEKRIRRQNFYERLGFIVDSRVKSYYFFEYYLLLTTPTNLPINTIKEEMKDLYGHISNPLIMKNFKMEIEE